MGYGEDGCERLWMTKTKVLSAQPNAKMLVHIGSGQTLPVRSRSYNVDYFNLIG